MAATPCIVHYKLNDRDGFYTAADSSGNGYNGSLNFKSSDYFIAGGKIGRAMPGGRIYCQLPSATTSVKGKAKATVCFWWQSPASWQVNAFLYFEPTSTAGNTRFAVLTSATGTTVYGLFRDSNTGTAYATAASSTLSTSTWYWLCLTFDSDANICQLYVNNAADGAYTSAFGPFSSDAPAATARLAANATGATKFKGTWDDFRIYDGVISSAERGFIYNSGNGTEDELPASFSTWKPKIMMY